MNRSALIALAVLLMGATFEPARRGYEMQFPADHRAHPTAKTEWWYYTGHLDGGGRSFGYQLTFFRVGMPTTGALGPKSSAWRAPDIHLAHFAVSDAGRQSFVYDERLQRGGVGLAWARPDRYDVANGTWGAKLEGDTHKLTATAPGGLKLTLALRSLKPPVRHGERGYSRKGECDTCASQYYSLTRLAAVGTLKVGGESIPVKGESWMDHEWGSNQLSAGQEGWDWFSVQLSDKSELMLYQLRGAGGQPVAASSGTFVRPDGSWRHLRRGDFTISPTTHWKSPASGATYPASWTLEVPTEKLRLKVTPTLTDQELRTDASTGETYWEGAVGITGSQTGRGFVELTGYARKFKARI